jgi:hypothetical protein
LLSPALFRRIRFRSEDGSCLPKSVVKVLLNNGLSPLPEQLHPNFELCVYPPNAPDYGTACTPTPAWTLGRAMQSAAIAFASRRKCMRNDRRQYFRARAYAGRRHVIKRSN